MVALSNAGVISGLRPLASDFQVISRKIAQNVRQCLTTVEDTTNVSNEKMLREIGVALAID